MEIHIGGHALSCRRYEGFDWSAFLREPQDAAFAEFRTHYPTCAECSAELRVWTELLAGVGATTADPVHPSPEDLECFDRAPAELDAARSDFIADHLRRCATCAEELHLLRGHDPSLFREVAESAEMALPPSTRTGFRWRQLPWSPAFGLVLAGLLLFPLLYRSVGPAPPAPSLRQEGAAHDVAPEPAEDLAKQAPVAPAPPLAAPRAKMSRSVVVEENDRDAQTGGSPAQPARAQPSGATELNVPSASVAPTVPVADSAEARRPAELAALDAESGVEDRARASAKSEDPLAHHVWIPTMRLRPGQTSSGPFSELRGGFFLEVPLPRDIPADEARVLIVPDGPQVRKRADARPEPLAAEERALEMLSKRDAARENAHTAPETGGSGGFEERVPVEAMQRALLLQVPPETLQAGVYKIDLELYSEGGVRGRGRFRLELVAE